MTSNYKVFTLLLTFLFLIPSGVYAQDILKTKSGQSILIQTDGSWSYLEEEESEQSGVDLSDFEEPEEPKYPLDANQQKTITELIKNLKTTEAQGLVDLFLNTKSQKNWEFEKSLAKSQKNKEKAKKADDQLKFLKANEKALKSAYKESSKKLEAAQKLASGSEKNFNKKLAKIAPEVVIEKPAIPVQAVYTPPTENESTTIASAPGDYPRIFKTEKTDYPIPSYDCEISFDGYDSEIEANKKEVQSEFFFGYTQPRLKAHTKDDDFMKVNASVSKVDGKYFLTLEFRMQSKDASRNYGSLSKNETIRLKTISGLNIYARNINSDSGTIEPYTGNTLYTGIFRIDKEDIKTLKNTYLDNIGVVWSSGFEEYPIYNVDFLMNQIECLEK